MSDEEEEEDNDDDLESQLSIEQRVVNQSDLDALTCPICLSLMTSPVKQCVSGHLGCESCLEKVAETTGRCPQCRIRISKGKLSRSLLADQMLSSLKVGILSVVGSMDIHCENQFRYNKETDKWEKDENGCQEITTVATSDDHMKTCKYNLLKCPFGEDFCDFTGTKEEVDKHILSELSDHIAGNHQYMNCQIESLKQQFNESIESFKESYNQQMNTQIQLLQQQIKSIEFTNVYTDEKLRKYKEKTKEMIKHTPAVQFEWVIENFGEKYKSKTDQESDDFKMGGFDWYIASYMDSNEDDTGQLGFYVHLHNNPGKLVKMCFTLEVVFSCSQSYSEQLTYIYDHTDTGSGFDRDPEIYLKGIQDNDSVTVQFKGFVSSIKDDPDFKK
ncbi:hypothetical protein DFA_01910 [Cavenderia fasciculata]|uniref:RING-type domain-containing protein n=1 Tax=Cavenderia fasciculata TaxID=261658 RepID=F4PQR3_CACFS|nr:uncharacterized protein DFA_01910 [Cavenderia fasciculata]EGG22021.1 hypothetical protein DFA_01910 [Cavenderia fasciculata]|eukprot:XP_004359872.1 hypothetical protein DFA_01910 [Cavenderia fasciculata]